MKTYTVAEMESVLVAHAAWLRGEEKGSRANLSGADLSEANLSEANLSWANLSGADFSGADLSGADLSEANLSWANLSGADLSGANLSGANLSWADLSRANLETVVGLHMIVPEVGAFGGFKKLRGGAIAHLRIPAGAARLGGWVGRKCRAEFVEVLSITASNGEALVEAESGYATPLVYRVGDIARPDKWDSDARTECSHGIHFFLTRREAEEYD